MKRYHLGAMLVSLAAAPCAAQILPELIPNAPTGAVEWKYFGNGPFTTAQTTSAGACDHKGNVCDVWYPTNLASTDRLPVVMWANGTSDEPVAPDIYGYYLSHLASWGFVVVATRDGKTGYGDTVLEALDWLKRRAGDRRDPFYGRLDFNKVGVGGHSQGATGAINAMLKSKGAIRTTIAYHLPAQMFCSPADLCVLTKDLTAATTGSIFYVSGSLDVVATDKQIGGGQLNSQTAYYNATPYPLLKAKGLLHGPNHTDLLGRPNCLSARPEHRTFCTFGSYGYLGLPTAWFAWQLEGDDNARRAFITNTGEFFAAKAWTGQASNIP